jgi:hypothetical protein
VKKQNQTPAIHFLFFFHCQTKRKNEIAESNEVCYFSQSHPALCPFSCLSLFSVKKRVLERDPLAGQASAEARAAARGISLKIYRS